VDDLVLAIGRVDLDAGCMTLHDGSTRRLTPQDCSLLAYLGARPHQDVPRDTLMTEVLGYAPSVTSRAVDDAMKRLRAKVERVPSRPFHLVSVRSVGYRFVPLDTNLDPNWVRLGQREIDVSRLMVRGPDGERTPLSSHEGRLLEVLLRHDGRPVKTADLLAEVWGIRDLSQRRIVNKLVYRLRAKLEDDPSQPHHLRTIRGRGLALDVSARPAPRVEGGTSCPRPSVEVLGRDELVRACRERLQAPGALVSLHGPAGIGKSTLAFATVDGWPGTVRYADLEGVRARDDVLAVLGAAIGADQDASGDDSLGPLGDALSDSPELLLVLDNAEAAVGTVSSLLEQIREVAPRLRTLVATRRTLGLDREQVIEVGPLAPPDARRVFLARASDAGLDLDPDDARLDRVVDEVERIPLALDLAAGRLRLLGLDGLVAGLDAPLSVLTRADDAADSLARSLGRTWDLLGSEDRTRLAACTVISGGLTPMAAERVLRSVVGGSSLDGLERLVDFALLQRASDGRLHPYLGVQEFVRTRLGADWDAMRARVQRAYATWLAEQGAPRHLGFIPEPEATHRLLPELPGAQAVLAEDLEPLQAARIVVWLGPLLAAMGRRRQAMRLITRCRRTPGLPHQLDRCLLAFELRLLEALSRRGTVQQRFGQALERAREHGDLELEATVVARSLLHSVESASLAENRATAEVAHRLLESFPEPAAEAQLRSALGWLAFRSGDLDTAWMELQDALSIARTEGAEWLAARLCFNLAGMCHSEGRLEEAEAFLERVREPYRVAEVPFQADDPDDTLGLIRLEQGRLDEAVQLHQRVLEHHRHTGNRQGLAIQANRLGTLRANQGNLEAATRWFEQAHSAFQAIGNTARGAGARYNLGKLALTRDALDEAEAAFREARDVFQDMGRSVHTGICMGGLAEVALQRGEHEQAEALARDALTRLDRGRATRFAADVRGLLAEIVSTHDVEAALPLADEAVEALASLGAPPLLGAALCRRAMVLHRRGDREAARQSMEQARSLAEGEGAGPVQVRRMLARLEAEGT